MQDSVSYANTATEGASDAEKPEDGQKQTKEESTPTEVKFAVMPCEPPFNRQSLTYMIPSLWEFCVQLHVSSEGSFENCFRMRWQPAASPMSSSRTITTIRHSPKGLLSKQQLFLFVRHGRQPRCLWIADRYHRVGSNQGHPMALRDHLVETMVRWFGFSRFVLTFAIVYLKLNRSHHVLVTARL